MFNEEKFKNRVIELINAAKHQRDSVGITLVEEFELSGKHTVSRLVKNHFGITLAEMLKMRFTHPSNWEEKLPNAVSKNSIDIYTRVMELRSLHTSFDTAKKTICEEFNITEMELFRRARSIFQKTLAEVFAPTKEEVDDAMLRSTNAQEFREILGLPSGGTTGIFQKFYGKDNYVNAKASLSNKIKVPLIVPNTADNEAIVFSQVLGGGSYDKVRGALRIAHGIKQLGYLKLKVSMLKNAYPDLNGMDKITTHIHTQGHEYCNWYSRRLPDHITRKVESFSFNDMVDNLTPLGWFLWFMDDGNLHNGATPSLNICAGIELSQHEKIKSALNSYGIDGNAYAKTYSIQKRVEIVKFLNTFVKPFEKIIPECMVYKTQFMI